VAKQRRVDQFLQTLQLQGDRWLRSSELSRGNSYAAGLNHRHERPKHTNIEAYQWHIQAPPLV
jgi:hypothetical protein